MLNIANSSVEISINAKTYESIINNVLCKAPIEMGVEIAVYMLLYGILDSNQYSVMDVNSMEKKKAKVYANKEVEEIDKVPDLVIVDKDFEYNNGENNEKNKEGALGIIEIKGLSVKYSKEEYDVQKSYTNYFIWTNGIEWSFNGKEPISLLKNSKQKKGSYQIDERKFANLLVKINKIKWKEKYNDNANWIYKKN